VNYPHLKAEGFLRYKEFTTSLELVSSADSTCPDNIRAPYLEAYIPHLKEGDLRLRGYSPFSKK